MDWLFSLADVETLKHIGGEALQSQIAGMTFVFTVSFRLAWKKIRKDMRTDMTAQFDSVTTAINGIGKEVRDGLHAQGERIGAVESGLNKLTTRVETLETKEK